MKECLTEREKKVLFHLAQGLTNIEISKKLRISTHTVKAHLESIYYKLSVSNRVQATVKALELKIIDIKRALNNVGTI